MFPPKSLEILVADEIVGSYNYKEVKIQSLIDSRLLYTGQTSGKQYEWSRGGDVILVDERDVPEMLSKRIGQRSCCGEGLLGNKVFEIYKE